MKNNEIAWFMACVLILFTFTLLIAVNIYPPQTLEDECKVRCANNDIESGATYLSVDPRTQGEIDFGFRYDTCWCVKKDGTLLHLLLPEPPERQRSCVGYASR